MTTDQNNDRTVLEITGEDRVKFLQDLVTNDLGRMADGLVYAALLSPQGKYLFDFFVFARGATIYIDVASDRATALAQRLTMYRLRAKVGIAASDLLVSRGLGTPPSDAMPDPRHPALGWRLYSETLHPVEAVDWNAIRVAHLIPETGIELVADDSYILEMGFERLSGVDFRKGCYVGQEVTARMKHKTELRKGLARVVLDGPAEAGTDINMGGKVIGRLHTVSGDQAMAYLRFDQAGDGMLAGKAGVRIDSAEA